MSASTYANRNADHANSAKNKSITNALVEQSNRHLKNKARENNHKKLGFDLSNYTGIDKEKVLNNCVAPEIGLAIFESALNIYNHSQNNQIGLFTQLG